MTYEALVEEVRALPIEQRKQLVITIFDSISEEKPKKKRSLLELEGIGAHLRDDSIDAQEYINQLRSESDDRP